MIDIDAFQALKRKRDWPAVHALLDKAAAKAVTREDAWRETYWRLVALRGQQRHQEALDLITSKAHLFYSRSAVSLHTARILERLGRREDAIAQLRDAPIEEEMTSYYGLALEAKFLYFHLLAKTGDRSAASRLAEIPDDFFTLDDDGGFVTKDDLARLLS